MPPGLLASLGFVAMYAVFRCSRGVLCELAAVDTGITMSNHYLACCCKTNMLWHPPEESTILFTGTPAMTDNKESYVNL